MAKRKTTVRNGSARLAVNQVQALSSWSVLNLALASMNDENDAWQLLDAEQRGKRRLGYLLRIYSRYNVLRARRERSQLLKEGA